MKYAYEVHGHGTSFVVLRTFGREPARWNGVRYRAEMDAYEDQQHLEDGDWNGEWEHGAPVDLCTLQEVYDRREALGID